MARKKRASIKDKGPETLGLSPKKGKGIDMLFGGPLEKNAPSASESSEAQSKKTGETSQPDSGGPTTATSEKEDDAMSGIEETTSVTPPPAPAMPPNVPAETLPVNEADEDASGVVSSAEEFDELGLPVAMEAPPADLEFASMPAQPDVGTGEKDAFDPSVSPFAVPSPAPVSGQPPAEIDDDLSGLVTQADQASLPVDDDLSGLAATDSVSTVTSAPPADLPPGPSPAAAAPAAEWSPAMDDLSGLTGAGDMTGLPAETGTTLPSSPSPAAPTTFPTPAPAASTFSTPASDLGSTESTFAPPAPGLEPVPGATPPEVSSTSGPGGSATTTVAAPPPPVPSLPRARIESLGGIITERTSSAEEDLLPADVGQSVDASYMLQVKGQAQVAPDQAKTAEVARYIGRERRENLDREIERLYGEVAASLSDNPKDASFALRKLSEAQDIILEDTRQYDEALYLVAVVKTMLAHKRNLQRWSYTWGLFVLFYALVWLIAFMAGFLLTSAIRAELDAMNVGVQAVRAAWFSALAGGIGGVIGIFYSLYWHVAYKQDFHRQYIMYYLVQPVMGFILGAVVYFILGTGFIFANFVTNPGSANSQAVLESSTVIAIQIVLGWIAGFRQRVVFEMIDRIVQKIMPRDKEAQDANPVSLAPPGER